MLRVNYRQFGSESFTMRQIVFRGWTRGELEVAWRTATKGIKNATSDPSNSEFFISVVVQGHLLDVVCASILWKSSCVPLIKRVRGERDRWEVNATRDLQANFVKRELLYNHYKV